MAKSRVIITGFDPNGPFGGLLLPWEMRKRQKETRFKQEWKLTMAQYAEMMMKPFKGRKFQRGMLSGMGVRRASVSAGPPTGNVVLNAHTGVSQFEDFAPFGVAICEASFQSNGQLWERNSVGIDDQKSGEWFDNEPIAGAGDYYEVRALSAGKVGTWNYSAAASDNTWITISSDRRWGVSKGSPNGNTTATATFEIGPDGVESADDSAAIKCNALYNDL